MLSICSICLTVCIPVSRLNNSTSSIVPLVSALSPVYTKTGLLVLTGPEYFTELILPVPETLSAKANLTYAKDLSTASKTI